MVVGIFLIFVGAVLMLMAPRWADKMVRQFGQLNSEVEVDPGLFKFVPIVLGIVAIICGAVSITRALL